MMIKIIEIPTHKGVNSNKLQNIRVARLLLKVKQSTEKMSIGIIELGQFPIP